MARLEGCNDGGHFESGTFFFREDKKPEKGTEPHLEKCESLKIVISKFSTHHFAFTADSMRIIQIIFSERLETFQAAFSLERMRYQNVLPLAPASF